MLDQSHTYKHHYENTKQKITEKHRRNKETIKKSNKKSI